MLHSSHLPTASAEQLDIVNALEHNNVIVDSVAGSGKTTTVMHIARKYPHKKILMLTYNTKLRIETNERIRLLSLSNITAHTYHSFYYAHFGQSSINDLALSSILKCGKIPTRTYNFDVLILDEAQDMTPLLFHAIKHLLSFLTPTKSLLATKLSPMTTTQFCVIGDRQQCIFAYNGADSRYITMADKIFDFDPAKKWSRLKLNESYRITTPMANFINNVVLPRERIVSNKKYIPVCGGISSSNSGLTTAPLPIYKICQIYGNEPFKTLLYYLDTLNIPPSDIFILAPSVKTVKSPVRRLANKITKNRPDISIFVPNNDEERLDEDIIRGKLVFSTFHQSKGLERRVVIIFSFDCSYIEFYNREFEGECPNVIYVAITRAKEHLVLFHSEEFDYLPFIRADKLRDYATVEGKLKIKSNDRERTVSSISITNLLRHVPYFILEECEKYISTKTIIIPTHLNDVEMKPFIPSKIESGSGSENEPELFENVADLNGIAIPLYYAFVNNRYTKIFNDLLNQTYEKNERTSTLRRIKDDILERGVISSRDLLYVANEISCYISGYIYKLNQIGKYDWIDEDALAFFEQRLKLLDLNGAKFEDKKDNKRDKIQGVIDAIDDERKIIWEFKCVQQLKIEHYLQLALYKLANETMGDDTNADNYRLFLVNLYDFEVGQIKIEELNISLADARTILGILADHKEFGCISKNDDEFLQCNRAKYVGDIALSSVDSKTVDNNIDDCFED